MVTHGIAAGLLDRHAERQVLDRLLEHVRGGQSSVLVVRGESGMGKSTLLDYAIDSACGFRIMRAVGVESEMELPFAALQQLCAPMLHRLEQLAAPQRQALQVAFGLTAGPAPDRFMVALATLSLFSEAAHELPLLVVVDDFQWLDRNSAQVLAFVARRLLAEPVALVFATRKPSEDLRGLPELIVHGLCAQDAQTLLRTAVHAPLDQAVEQRLVEESRGNPLALTELPRTFTTDELAGGFGLPIVTPVSDRIEDCFRRRLVTLPPETRQLLVVAAADPVGDPVRVWRAAELLGITPEAAEPAEAEGFLRFGTRVTFRHAVVRSVVYQAASLQARRAAHRALARVIDPKLDPDRRAWHLAQAACGPDEEVAGELERSAVRARARGGVAAEAAFLERAAALTLEPAGRTERALAAAQAKYRAGAFDSARALLATAEAGPLSDLQRAHVDLLRARIKFATRSGSDATPLLLGAAKRFRGIDPALARETYLEALTSALYRGSLDCDGVRNAASAARAAPSAPQPPRASDFLLDGLALLATDGPAAAAPVLRVACNAFRQEELTAEEGLRWMLAAGAIGFFWDGETWDALTGRLIKLARNAGELTVLSFALTMRTTLEVFAGEFAVAASVIEEVGVITQACRSRGPLYGALALAGFRGREAEAWRTIEATRNQFRAAGEGMGLTCVEWVTAVLCNGLGRYAEAQAAAARAADDCCNLRYAGRALTELVEAASRTGDDERGAEALRRLTELTRAGGTDWALGIEARSRALLSDRKTAECLYQEAIDRLSRTRLRVDLARAHLLYGEWLRRDRRRLEAREQLRQAHELFLRFGAEGFAERARIELNATGERARKRVAHTRDELTPQEAQIARLAAEGETNHAIAAQLFISASTVDYHLRKAFRKLGVTSRGQLARHVLAA